MTMTTELNKYLQSYLNDRAKGRLPLRVFFNQPTNNSDNLKMGKGRYGRGVYTSGKIIDRNTEDTPDKWQHTTAPELVLDALKFQTDFNGDMTAADKAGYVGVRYDDDEKKGTASYFLFPDTVPLKTSGGAAVDNTAVYVNPNTGKESKLIKDGNRWSIDGLNKTFRTKDKAIKHLQKEDSLSDLTGEN